MSVSTQNVIPPFDTTGYEEISGAQLKQLIDGINMFTDKGLTILTTDVDDVIDAPDANTNTQWQRCIWLRKTSAGIIPYVWNASFATDYSQNGNNMYKWVTISSTTIGPRSITGPQIALTTVLNENIDGMSAMKLIGPALPSWMSALFITTSSVAGSSSGVIIGNWDTLTIAPGKIATSMLGAGQVTSDKVASPGIVTANLTDTCVTGPKLNDSLIGQLANSKASPVAADTIMVGDSADSFKLKRSTLAGVSAGLGNTIVQQKNVWTRRCMSTAITTLVGAANQVPALNPFSVPTYSDPANPRGVVTAGVLKNYFDYAFTPAKTTSTVVVTGSLYISTLVVTTGIWYNIIISLYDNTTFLGSSLGWTLVDTNSYYANIQFKIPIVNTTGAVLNLKLNINSVIAGVGTAPRPAWSVGCVYTGANVGRPLFNTSSQNMLTDSDGRLVAVPGAGLDNMQDSGAWSGYDITEYV